MRSWIDPIDLRILEILEQDGRASCADIAAAVGLSRASCWTRIQTLQEAGVIVGYRCRVDRTRVGRSITCFVDVALENGRDRAFEGAVARAAPVRECHRTTGSWDYLLRVAARDVRHLEGFLRQRLARFPGVTGFRTRLCLRSRPAVRPLAALAALRSAAPPEALEPPSLPRRSGEVP